MSNDLKTTLAGAVPILVAFAIKSGVLGQNTGDLITGVAVLVLGYLTNKK